MPRAYAATPPKGLTQDSARCGALGSKDLGLGQGLWGLRDEFPEKRQSKANIPTPSQGGFQASVSRGSTAQHLERGQVERSLSALSEFGRFQVMQEATEDFR